MEATTQCRATRVLEREQSGHVRLGTVLPGMSTFCDAQLSNWEQIWQDWLDGKPWALLALSLCNDHFDLACDEAREHGLIW